MSEDAKNTAELAGRLFDTIMNCNDEMKKFAPDAIMRVLVHIAFLSEWNIEQLEEETKKAIKYYYKHEKEYLERTQ